MGEDILRTELYIQNGVLVENIEPNKGDIDFRDNLGTLTVVEYTSDIGKCIEWHQCHVSIESHDQEWAIVKDVNNHTEENTQNPKKPVVQMQIEKLMNVRLAEKKLTLRGEGMKVTFYFQSGSARSFVQILKRVIGSSMLPGPADTYVITSPKEIKVLEKSFAELDLFTDDQTRTTILWNFVKRLQSNPYETTMNTFSKVTNTFLYGPQYDTETVNEMVHKIPSGEEVTDSNTRPSSDDYEVVSKGPPLPPRTLPLRGEPLNEEQWISHFDESGKIINPDAVKEIIFRGGITSSGSLRKEVWKYLLDYYPWDSTPCERAQLRKEKEREYYRMKLQWQSMSADQADRFGAYKMRMSLIEKDVHRTDRNLEYFAGENNPNLTLLQDILMTYVMYNFDLGYVQGMNDLLSPLLVQLGDEVDTFWCFVGFMNRVSQNFELDQEGMKEQLRQLYGLLCAVEPEFATSLDQDSKSVSFCFRWLLVWFKREFSYKDIYLMWEVLWTGYHCKNYHLFICTAILDNEKETLMSNGFGFTEILKHINELANRMDIEQILRKAEGIYAQISSASNIPPIVREILGLEPISEASDRDEKLDAETKESDSIIRDSFNAKLIDDEKELAFHQSLDLQYL